MVNFLSQPGYYSYRMGNKVLSKPIKHKLTGNDFYFFFATSLRKELEELRKAFICHQNLGHIQESHLEIIEKTYGRAMQATYLNFFKGPRVSQGFFKYIDMLDAWTSDQKSRTGKNADPSIPNDLNKTLVQLFEAIEHYIRQCRMTGESFKAVSRVPAHPTNWTVKDLIKHYIEEYVPTGKKKFPPYVTISKQLASHDPSLKISERMYRLYKRQIENGTFTHIVQKKRQQVTRVHDT